MRSFRVLTENGPLLVLTSMENTTEDILLKSLHGKGIDKFIAYEVPVEKVHEFYGVPFEIISADLERGKKLEKVLPEFVVRTSNIFPLPLLNEQLLQDYKQDRVFLPVEIRL